MYLAGIGWYRKSFPAAAAGKQLFIQFEGVYMNSDVWVNGQHVGNWPYGYTTFEYDITPFMVQSGNNTVAVRVNNTGVTSRWYSGSGIYRHTCTDSPRTESIFRTPIGEHCWGVLDYCPAKYVRPRTPASL